MHDATEPLSDVEVIDDDQRRLHAAWVMLWSWLAG